MKTCCTPGTAETRKGSHGEGTLPLSERRSQPAKGSGGEGAEQREHPRRWCGAHAVTVERSMELSFFLLIVSIVPFGEGNGNPLQCSCLENPRDGGAWWAAVYGVAKSRTRLSNKHKTNILIPAQLTGGLTTCPAQRSFIVSTHKGRCWTAAPPEADRQPRWGTRRSTPPHRGVNGAPLSQQRVP